MRLTITNAMILIIIIKIVDCVSSEMLQKNFDVVLQTKENNSSRFMIFFIKNLLAHFNKILLKVNLLFEDFLIRMNNSGIITYNID